MLRRKLHFFSWVLSQTVFLLTFTSSVPWRLAFGQIFRSLTICFLKYEQSCFSSSRSCEAILIWDLNKNNKRSCQNTQVFLFNEVKVSFLVPVSSGLQSSSGLHGGDLAWTFETDLPNERDFSTFTSILFLCFIQNSEWNLPATQSLLTFVARFSAALADLQFLLSAVVFPRDSCLDLFRRPADAWSPATPAPSRCTCTSSFIDFFWLTKLFFFFWSRRTSFER